MAFLVGQEPALAVEAPAIPHQFAPASDHPMAGNQDGQIVGSNQLSHQPGVEPSLPRYFRIRTGRTERDPADGAMHSDHGRRRIEPPAESLRIPERSGPALEVGIEERAGPIAAAFPHVDGGCRTLDPHCPAYPAGAARVFDHDRPSRLFHQAQGPDGRLVDRGLKRMCHVSMQPTAAGERR